MKECLCCERSFDEKEPLTDIFKSETYCTPECQLLHEAVLQEAAESSKIKGLVDAEGNSILGSAYQQRVSQIVKDAASRIGIKLPPEEK